jgi:hypothetical protein
LSLAAVLGVDAGSLFGSLAPPLDVVSGAGPAEGALVRVGWVGDQVVTSPARVGGEGWDVADGMVVEGSVTTLALAGPGVVVAGCEPGLVLLERLLREGGLGAVAASASSVSAIAALVAGRLHAAVVHGPEGRLPQVPEGLKVVSYHFTRWRVGLVAPAEHSTHWWQDALSGRVPVVQREPGAGVQQAFEEAVGAERRPVAGPKVGSHLESARLAVTTGIAGVTIEPAALAVGGAFHPLDSHVAQIWVDERWVGDPVAESALTVISSGRFLRRLAGVGGYDLSGCGTKVA